MSRNITITFGDGTTHSYQNVPDNVTPDQVEARAAKEFSKPINNIDGGRGSSQPQAKQEPAYSPTIAESALGLERGGTLANMAQASRNAGLGALRGAGSIGATLMAPADAAARALEGTAAGRVLLAPRNAVAGALDVNPQSLVGRTDRRQAMTDATQSLGADPNSAMYALGKTGAEIAGTAGAGGAVANTLSRVPGVASAAPNLLSAIGSGGMTGGNLLTRATGGAIAGGATAGLINPEDADAGALVGGVTPGVIQGAGKVGNALGRMVRGPEQTPQMAEAVRAARDLGLVIPPTQAKASLANRLLEGTAGKLTTAQNASAANSKVVNRVAAEALGLPADTQLTPENIGYVKKAAGALYDAVGSAGTVQPGAAYTKALDDIVAPHLRAAAGFPNAKPSPVVQMVDSLRSDAFDAASAVAKIKELRSMADDAFKPGGQGADIGRAAKSAAKALEGALDDHLKAIGQPDLLDQFRQARELYAKASTIERATDAGTGTVDARKLAAQLQKGKPLSGDIKKLAEAAAQFKTAFKTPEQMGSLPQFSPLDLYGSAGVAGGLGAITGNPLSALALGIPAARAGARSVALSPMVQNRLIQGAQSAGTPMDLSLLYRAAPALAADR